MSPKRVRTLFIVVGLGLLLQYGVVGLVGLYGAEPWPAVVLPGFKTVYDSGGTVFVERAVIHVAFENGERKAVETARFLSPLPRSHHPSFLQAQCQPAALSGTPNTERCRTPEGRQWFLDRAAAVFPTRPIQDVTITWEQFRLDLSSGHTLTRPLDSLSVVSLPSG